MNSDLYEFYERYGYPDERRCFKCGHFNLSGIESCSKCGYRLKK